MAYYVKTAEYFTHYSFTSTGVTVQFEIQSADVEQNNVKGDKRFFLPRCKDIVWDEKAGLLTIPFEYRPLTEQEEIIYGKKNQQEAVNAKAVEDIPKKLKKAERALLAVIAERRKDADGKSVIAATRSDTPPIKPPLLLTSFPLPDAKYP